MPKQSKYTKEKLEPIVAQSQSIMEVLRRLGLKETGGNHSHIKNVIKKLNLDTSHFLGQGWNKGKTFEKRPLEDYLSNRVKIRSHPLKLRLISAGVKEWKCEKCGLSDWRGEFISLELDHINGDHFDNRLENLQILCPNCHAQKTHGDYTMPH